LRELASLDVVLAALRRWIRRHPQVRKVVGRLAGRVLSFRDRKLTTSARWSKEVGHEATFWRDWIATHAFGDEQDFAYRLDPDAILNEALIAERLDRFDDEVAILDVGAGPLTTLGKQYPGKSLKIRAVDPLADQYDAILAEAGLEPPVRTEPGDGERLLDLFPAESFDIAYAANALDHSYDPMQAVESMVALVRPGGFVALRHHRNEANQKSYLGLHQWNFDSRDGRFVIWNREGSHDMNARVEGRADVECRIDGDEVVCVLERR
jgi:SAM-dependent methyltransferase